jgi:phosphate transport system protein
LGESSGPDIGGHGHNHVLRDQDALWRDLLDLAARVSSSLSTAVEALCGTRTDLVAEVRAGERAVDRWEVRIERECLRILALYGLAASDLRRVVAALRVIRDLEGLADLAENLAKRAKKLGKDPVATPYLARLRALAERSLLLVRMSISALEELDPERARHVIASDKEVDSIRLEVVSEIKRAIPEDPDRVATWLRLINSARNLERAADHATNIAEAVVAMKEGAIIRRGDSIENGGALE